MHKINNGDNAGMAINNNNTAYALSSPLFQINLDMKCFLEILNNNLCHKPIHTNEKGIENQNNIFNVSIIKQF